MATVPELLNKAWKRYPVKLHRVGNVYVYNSEVIRHRRYRYALRLVMLDMEPGFKALEKALGTEAIEGFKRQIAAEVERALHDPRDHPEHSRRHDAMPLKRAEPHTEAAARSSLRKAESNCN